MSKKLVSRARQIIKDMGLSPRDLISIGVALSLEDKVEGAETDGEMMSTIMDETSATKVSEVLEVALDLTLMSATLPRLSEAERGGLMALRDVSLMLDVDLWSKIEGMLQADLAADRNGLRAV